MVILLIFLLLIILLTFLYFLFRLVKWIFKKKTRIKWSLTLLAIFVLATFINVTFFTKMEFIPSKVYPDLYLIKNPISDRDSINKVIKKMVLQKVNSELIGNKEKKEFSKKSSTTFQYKISFYEYYKGSVFIPFGEAGTAHFIAHEEDPGGFSSELIAHYDKYRIAEFYLKFCRDDTLNYIGTINYYQNWEIIKTDTLINTCQINSNEEISEPVFEGH